MVTCGDKQPWLHLFLFEYDMDNDVPKTDVEAIELNELLTLMVPKSKILLAGSEKSPNWRKTI